jgi:hypothetical protein
MGDSVHVGRKYWAILFTFGFIGAGLFTLDALVSLPSQAHSLTQSVAEALVVAVVVSLAVEPRLLRYFGEELSSQTFWASFFSRAPVAYREAIKELAATTDFAHAFNFSVSFDWADEERTVVKMTAEWIEHRENRSSKPLPVEINAWIPQSRCQGFDASFTSCSILCQERALYANLMDSEDLEVTEGSDSLLFMTHSGGPRVPFFQAPAGGLYTKMTSAVTYFGPTGIIPYIAAGPVLEFNIKLSGTALPDLYFSIMHPGQGTQGTVSPVVEGMGTDLAAKGPMRIGGVFIEGQSVVLSWNRKNHSGGDR